MREPEIKPRDRFYEGCVDSRTLDFYYRQLKRIKGFPKDTLQGIVRELSYRKAFEPIYSTKYNKTHEMDLNTASCPRCGRDLKTGATGSRYLRSGLGVRYEFCPKCGQRIDWSKFVITDPYSDEAIRARVMRRVEEKRREREQQANQGVREEADVAGLESPDNDEQP